MASFEGIETSLFSLNGEGGFDVDGVRVLVRCGEIARVGKLRFICFMCRDDVEFESSAAI